MARMQARDRAQPVRIRQSSNVRQAAATRKRHLIGTSFDKSFLKPIEFASVEGLTPNQIARNWSSVSLETYGQIIGREIEWSFPSVVTRAGRNSRTRNSIWSRCRSMPGIAPPLD